ncbi:MAG: hypothetical protein ACRDKT_05890 [Actinomycetota bacterium]
MHVRFCPRCRADVEDVGGFCLLGHPLAVPAQDDPIADLRSEVDRAFEKVQVDIDAALDPLQSLALENERPAVAAVAGRAEAEPEAEQMLEDMQVTSKALWAPLEHEAPLTGNDPIVAFAPSPRMDWGPEKTKGRRSGHRRPRTV